MTMKKRGFEIVTSYLDKNIHLPVRQTKASAGYDFETSEDVVVPSIWKQFLDKWFDDINVKATLIPTGV